MTEISREVLRYAEIMERELWANEPAKGKAWKESDPKALLLDVYYHTGKLQQALLANDKVHVIEHAADIGNMAMMVLDRLYLLEDPKWFELVVEEQKKNRTIMKKAMRTVSQTLSGIKITSWSKYS